jgi:hypothetical protein
MLRAATLHQTNRESFFLAAIGGLGDVLANIRWHITTAEQRFRSLEIRCRKMGMGIR